MVEFRLMGQPFTGLNGGPQFQFNGCGRDAHYCTPPAQNRTCGFPAYGSHLG
jgi:hypothetical protein